MSKRSPITLFFAIALGCLNVSVLEASGLPKASEQALIKGSELRVIDSLWAHFAMLCIDPADQQQIDQNLAELLATPV